MTKDKAIEISDLLHDIRNLQAVTESEYCDELSMMVKRLQEFAQYPTTYVNIHKVACDLLNKYTDEIRTDLRQLCETLKTRLENEY